MRKRLVIIACALAALAVAVLPATARQAGAGGGVALKQIGNFDQPVYVTGAPGFPKLLFVVEQEGRIKVLHRGRKLRRSFLNITSLVRDSYEQGLLSVAFPPTTGAAVASTSHTPTTRETSTSTSSGAAAPPSPPAARAAR